MSVLDKLSNLFSIASIPNKKSDDCQTNRRRRYRASVRSDNYRKLAILISNINELLAALDLTSNMRVCLLHQWCRENGWSNLQLVDLQFYAIPSGGFIPVLLPEEALTELEKYHQAFDTLWEIQFLESISEVSKDNALLFTGFCLLLLCLKEVFKRLPNPGDIHQLINLAVTLLIVIDIVYTWTLISSYWKQYQCKSKLSRTPGFVDLLISLDNSIKRV